MFDITQNWHVKNNFCLYLIILIIQGCTNSNNSLTDKEIGPSCQPKSFPLNNNGGYNFNVVTGGAIHPLINVIGDTIKTGIPVQAKGKLITLKGNFKSTRINGGLNPQKTKINYNYYKHTGLYKNIPVDKSKLKKIKLGYGNSDYVSVNSNGDTVKSDIPQAAKGNKVNCLFPKSTKALPLQMKDNAICDIQYLDVGQGMNSSFVQSMIIDKSGNIWFGTNGGGVTKYDGVSFNYYTENEGLINKYVQSMVEDEAGNLWFGTDEGISKYDGEAFTQFTEKDGLIRNFTWSILKDKKGNIWFGSNEGGVCRYNGNSFFHFTEKEGLSNNTIRCIYEDKSGNIWFGTGGGGVSKFDGNFFTHFTESNGLSNNEVLSIIEDKEGNMWFGTSGGGVSKYDGKSFVNFTTKEGLTNNIVGCIFQDKLGNIWFGTDGGGACKFDGKSFTYFTEKEGLSSNYVRAIIEDYSGNIWFATLGGGVTKYRNKSFVHLTTNDGLSSNDVTTLIEDKSGSLWLGTLDAGIIKYKDSTFEYLTINDGLSNKSVRSILEDRLGNIWIGTVSGDINKFDGKNIIQYTRNEGLPDFYKIFSIIEDKSGNIWFGTENGGVLKYNGKSFVHYTESDGLSSKSVRSILEDRFGNIWFASYGGGVTKFDGKYFINYTEKEGLSNNYLSSILEDKSGNIWFGTFGGGITKFNGKSFTHFTENEGLSSNAIFSIKEDNMGGIWIGTEKGLNLIKTSPNLNSPQSTSSKANIKASLVENEYVIESFDMQLGLKGLYFNNNSVLLDSKNRIWWGTNKALEMLNLNIFKAELKTPEITLKDLVINETFIDYRNISDSLKEQIKFKSVTLFENYPINLELPYDKNHLTFHFSAIDWAAPNKIKYQYMIDGLDQKWSSLDDKTEADYRNLPYGTFTFKVRAIGKSQIMSVPLEYKFTIHPPWWHTSWFRIFIIVIIISSIFLYIKWRERKLKAEKEVLEQTVIERTAEVVEEKKIVEEQKNLIEEKHKEITDSINYAERIQRSFIATREILDGNLKDYFVFFKPKDVVSGDFYWASKLSNNQFALATADSTGHGVPGAIMSLLNITSLEKAIEDNYQPSDILNATRKIIIERLKKDGSKEGGKDGMDCSLICFDFKNLKINVTAANNPVWIVRSMIASGNKEVIEIKPDKMPVGKHDKDNISFTQKEIELQKGDVIYTLTDGFPDQFGGPFGKKFMSKNLRELLSKNAHLPMHEQKSLLETTFKDWVGDLEQVDDVTIIGIRV